MSKFSKALITLIVGAVIGTLVTLSISSGWFHLTDKIWGTHSNTYIYLIGQEHSYTFSQLQELSPMGAKLTVIVFKIPEGASFVTNNLCSASFRDWIYPKNTKLYTIIAYNKGAEIDRDIKIDIDFTPCLIESINIPHKERVGLIWGGAKATKAVFKIDELFPDENQEIEILIKGNKIRSLNAWSPEQKDIKNIVILDVILEPDKN